MSSPPKDDFVIDFGFDSQGKGKNKNDDRHFSLDLDRLKQIQVQELEKQRNSVLKSDSDFSTILSEKIIKPFVEIKEEKEQPQELGRRSSIDASNNQTYFLSELKKKEPERYKSFGIIEPPKQKAQKRKEEEEIDDEKRKVLKNELGIMKQSSAFELPSTRQAKRKHSIKNSLDVFNEKEGSAEENDVEKNDADIQCKNLLQEWYRFAQEQAILHDMCRSYFRSYGNNLAISAILLSTVGGASSIATSSVIKHYSWLPILFGGVGLFSGALMSIHRFLNLPELQRAHNFYSDEYAKLKNEIYMQLHIYKGFSKTYTNLTEFSKKCKHTLDSLIDCSPPIRTHIMINYEKSKKKRKSGSWYIPSILINNTAFTKT